MSAPVTAHFDPPVPKERTVVLRMSEVVAGVLYTLVGEIVGGNGSTDLIYDALKQAGVPQQPVTVLINSNRSIELVWD